MQVETLKFKLIRLTEIYKKCYAVYNWDEIFCGNEILDFLGWLNRLIASLKTNDLEMISRTQHIERERQICTGEWRKDECCFLKYCGERGWC